MLTSWHYSGLTSLSMFMCMCVVCPACVRCTLNFDFERCDFCDSRHFSVRFSLCCPYLFPALLHIYEQVHDTLLTHFAFRNSLVYCLDIVILSYLPWFHTGCTGVHCTYSLDLFIWIYLTNSKVRGLWIFHIILLYKFILHISSHVILVLCVCCLHWIHLSLILPIGLLDCYRAVVLWYFGYSTAYLCEFPISENNLDFEFLVFICEFIDIATCLQD